MRFDPIIHHPAPLRLELALAFTMSWPPLSFPISFFVLVVVLILVVSGLFGRRRKTMWRAWRQTHQFAPLRGSQFHRDYPFEIFSKGDSGRIATLAEGEWHGRKAYAGDGFYYQGSGKNRRKRNYAFVVIEPGVALPEIRIRPQTTWDGVASIFGFDDINFESAEFSREFHVSSNDRRRCYELITRDVMDALLPKPKLSYEFRPEGMICYRRRRWTGDELTSALEQLHLLIHRLPRQVSEETIR